MLTTFWLPRAQKKL